MKNTILFKIECNLYSEIEKIRSRRNMTFRDMIFSIVEKEDIVLPVQRKVEKAYMLSAFNAEFSFQSTTIQLYPEEITWLESKFPTYPLTHILHSLLYVYIQNVKDNWSCPYFKDKYFSKYLYSESDFVNAFNELTNKKNHLTQRDYNENKEDNYPTLYVIRKKYGSFQKFVEKCKYMV
ncbi:hypothetical protein [Peribacillus loiseleuriae]|uniref:hypothetical protein n=1 Tax=Peribacillus loiseleuriae TaxID=1679170 RepID=UPI003CFC47C2